MRPSLPALALAATLAASSFGAATAYAAPANSNVVGYLALGESSADGFGVAPDQSYPALLSDAQYANIGLSDRALSGADTYDVLHTQLPTSTGNQVVTLTIGANDLDWGGVLRGDPAALDQLEGRFAALAGVPSGAVSRDGDPVQSIASVIGAAQTTNPGATILVTGYPHLFGTSDEPCDLGGGQIVPPGSMAQTNLLVDQLNMVISGGVAAANGLGANAVYVDVTDDFAGHGLCDMERPWLFDVDDPSTVAPPQTAAFHPNARGQKAYSQAIADSGFRKTALVFSRAK